MLRMKAKDLPVCYCADMKDVSLETLVKAAVQELDEIGTGIPPKPSHVEQSIRFYRLLKTELSAASELKRALAAEGTFGNLCNGWVSHQGMGHVIQEHSLPLRLVEAARHGNQLSTMFRDVRAFADSGISSVDMYAPLVGVQIKRTPIEISEQVSLVSWSDVPSCHQKDKFGKHDDNFESISPMRPLPHAAIRFHFPEQRILFASADEARDLAKANFTSHNDAISTIYDVMHSLTILTASPVAVLGTWVHVVQDVPRSFAGASYSFNDAVFDQRLFHAAQNPVLLANDNRLADVVLQYRAFSATDRDALTIAMNRVGASLKKRTIVDRAIDLGIGLEAMLLHSIGNEKDRGELRYRAAVRGAVFLGNKSADRKDVYEIIRAAYNLRSAAVHTGRLDPKNTERDTETLSKASQIACQMALKLIENGRFPNWETEFIFRDP